MACFADVSPGARGYRFVSTQSNEARGDDQDQAPPDNDPWPSTPLMLREHWYHSRQGGRAVLIPLLFQEWLASRVLAV